MAFLGCESGGAAQSWVLANRSERMRVNDYPLGFKVALHRKDLGIALDLAREMGADLPVTELAADFETDLVGHGHAAELLAHHVGSGSDSYQQQSARSLDRLPD